MFCKNSIFQLTQRVWKLISYKRKKQTIIVFLLMLLSSFAEVLSIGAIFPFIAILLNPNLLLKYQIVNNVFLYLGYIKPADLLIPVSVFFCIATLLSALIRLLLMWSQFKLGASISIDFSKNAYEYALFQPYSEHATKNSTIYQSTISKANELGTSLIIPLLILFSSSIIILILMILLVNINPPLVLSTIFGFFIIYFIISQATKKKLLFESKKMSIENINLIKSIQEGLGGIRDVIIDGSQKYFVSLYEKSIIPFRRSWVNVNIIGTSPKYLVEAFSMILIVTIATVFAKSEKNTQNIIPIIGALAIGAQRILPIMQQLYSSFVTIKGNQASINDAIMMLEDIPKIPEKDTIKQLEFKLNINISNVSFKYSESNQYVFENIFFTIKKGERVGMIGSTGSGKSTMIDLIMGLLTPTSGQILIDNIILDQSNLRSWQGHIAHVPQNIYLSDTSIKENIAFGLKRDSIDEDKIIQAAKSSMIYSTIIDFENNFETFVGERGLKLSGGQKQRIGIARALYKNADLLIFDEATSALDNHTENEVMQSIKMFDSQLTILIVAHRLSTLKYCDKIYEFTSNGLRMYTSYEELMNNKSN